MTQPTRPQIFAICSSCEESGEECGHNMTDVRWVGGSWLCYTCFDEYMFSEYGPQCGSSRDAEWDIAATAESVVEHKLPSAEQDTQESML